MIRLPEIHLPLASEVTIAIRSFRIDVTGVSLATYAAHAYCLPNATHDMRKTRVID
jgi:hypothetical protein